MQLNMPNFANGPGQPFEPPLFTTVCYFTKITQYYIFNQSNFLYRLWKDAVTQKSEAFAKAFLHVVNFIAASKNDWISKFLASDWFNIVDDG